MKASFIKSAVAGVGLAAALTTPATAQGGTVPTQGNAANACVLGIIEEDKEEVVAAGGGILEYDKLDLLGMIAECEAKTGVDSTLMLGDEGPSGIKIIVNAAAAAKEPVLDADGCVSAEIARQIHDIGSNGGGALDLDETAVDKLIETCEAETNTKTQGFFGMTRFKLTVPAF